MLAPKFGYLEFEWDERNLSERSAHGLEFWEAEESFFLPYRLFRSKSKTGRKYRTFKLEGLSEAGRSILVIFYVKAERSRGWAVGASALIRVIAGWEV